MSSRQSDAQGRTERGVPARLADVSRSFPFLAPPSVAKARGVTGACSQPVSRERPGSSPKGLVSPPRHFAGSQGGLEVGASIIVLNRGDWTDYYDSKVVVPRRTFFFAHG